MMNRTRTERMGRKTMKGAPKLSPWHRTDDSGIVYFESNPGDPEMAYGRHSRFMITKCEEEGDLWWMVEDQRVLGSAKDFDTLADAKAYCEDLVKG